ncbi:MAG: hypothetical protein A4S09_15100 [Proteobacteria bacterium SG_bin7]|nr:MAG: hypothetical protein A4S09_15100 [Proteobacteria bacterium SG_bin7]
MSAPEVTIARKIYFSSGHRYYNPRFSEEENKKLFGKAYSVNGYGHNFILEVYLNGPVNADSGIVINLIEIDNLLKKVTDPFDHHFINTDVPFFKDVIPTTENMAVYFYNKIRENLPSKNIKLLKIRLYEGEFMWVDYAPSL